MYLNYVETFVCNRLAQIVLADFVITQSQIGNTSNVHQQEKWENKWQRFQMMDC